MKLPQSAVGSRHSYSAVGNRQSAIGRRLAKSATIDLPPERSRNVSSDCRLPTADCRFLPTAGFLALDAIAAAAIAALVGAALLTALLTATAISRRAARETQALVLARLALAMDARKAAANGQASATAADNAFSWTIRAQPIGPDTDPAAFHAYNLIVEVRDAAGVATRLETARAISLSERAP